MMKIHAVMAVSLTGIIGRRLSNGAHVLPWYQRTDLRRFKQLTVDHPVLMGWNTFAAMQLIPLAARYNVVLTNVIKRFVTPASNLQLANSIGFALDLCIDAAKRMDTSDIMVIGGASVFRQLWPNIDVLHISLILDPAPPEPGDVLFAPALDALWQGSAEWAFDGPPIFWPAGDKDMYPALHFTLSRPLNS